VGPAIFRVHQLVENQSSLCNHLLNFHLANPGGGGGEALPPTGLAIVKSPSRGSRIPVSVRSRRREVALEEMN
jgi:hypothetical protein